MELVIEENNGYTEKILVMYTPAEWLMVNKAMRLAAQNNSMHIADKDIINNMIARMTEEEFRFFKRN